jgi:hypothetical protein
VRKALGLLAAVLFAVTGCATGRVPVSTTDSPAPVAARPDDTDLCPKPGVVISAGTGDAAMGLRVLTIEMRNCGLKPFTVNGYPDIQVLDEDERPLSVSIVEGSTAIALIPDFDVPPAEVTLQPGESAIAGIVWRNLVTDANVEAVDGAKLGVAPMAGSPWQVITPHGKVDLGNSGRLGVTAWHRAPVIPTTPPRSSVPPTTPRPLALAKNAAG